MLKVNPDCYRGCVVGDSVKYGNVDAISAITDGYYATIGIDKMLIKK